MHCIHCGAQLPDGAKFCTSCGARQPESAASVYTPPVQEKPAEPQSSGYTPPASGAAGQQSGYTYDPTIYTGREKAQGEPKKKGGALVFIILAALVVVGALIYIFTSLSGGKSTADDAVLGLYTAQKAETYGITISIRTMWKDGFTIELKDKGKATLNVDGKSGSAKWTLDGEKFTVKGSGVDCSGTLVNGVLTLEDVMGTGVTLYFTKDGAELPSDTTLPAASVAPAESSAPASSSSSYEGDVTGLYNADKAEAYGIEIEISTMWEKGFSIELLDNGKCNLIVNGTKGSGTWSRSGDTVTIEVPGFNMDGRIENGALIFEDLYGMGVTLFFTKDGSLIPSGKTTAEPAPASTGDYAWWEGDWYGWWTSATGGGKYQGVDGSAWDACAQIEVYSDGTGYIELWDQDGDYVIEGEVSFGTGLGSKGCMVGKSVTFLGYELDANAWTADPVDANCAGFDKLFCISARFTDPDNPEDWLEYYVYMRPWGTRWEDIEDGDTSDMLYPGDMLPLNYVDWYLPLIEAGKSMPLDFEGLSD